jgi:hypothetical protein
MKELITWVKAQSDRALAVVIGVTGVLFVLLGWYGVSGATLTTEQLPYLASGAVGGLFALGVAATLWLSADMRDERHKLDEIHTMLQDGTGPPDEQAPSDDATAGRRG